MVQTINKNNYAEIFTKTYVFWMISSVFIQSHHNSEWYPYLTGIIPTQPMATDSDLMSGSRAISGKICRVMGFEPLIKDEVIHVKVVYIHLYLWLLRHQNVQACFILFASLNRFSALQRSHTRLFAPQ